MAVKTITIDMPAYDALKRRKRPGQSFSDVIKEHFTRGVTGAELLRALVDLPVDASALDAADELVRGRASDQATAPEL
ncbi:MAG: antitoxin VapB family protein [Gemmatimonadota bacterium]